MPLFTKSFRFDLLLGLLVVAVGGLTATAQLLAAHLYQITRVKESLLSSFFLGVGVFPINYDDFLLKERLREK